MRCGVSPRSSRSGRRSDDRKRAPRVTSGQAELLARTLDAMHRDLGIDVRVPQTGEEQSHDVEAGDRVHVTSWEQDGTVIEDLGNDVLVQMGAMRVTVPKSDIRRIGAGAGVTLSSSKGERRSRDSRTLRQAQGDTGGYGETALEAATTAQTQIDVRGKRFVEAEPLVERWIDDAILLGHSPLRLIHGKGTGLLGKGLQQYLKAHPFVQNVRYGNADEGGGGVTVFELRSPTRMTSPR